jgi:hypothetical protein
MNRVSVLLTAGLLGTAVGVTTTPSAVRVCGRAVDLPFSRTCAVIGTSRAMRDLLVSRGTSMPLAPPRPAPFYSVTFQRTNSRRWRLSYLYVPSRGSLRLTSSAGASWIPAPRRVSTRFRALRLHMRPFAAPVHWP